MESQGTIVAQLDTPEVLHAVIVVELKQNYIFTRYQPPPPVPCSPFPPVKHFGVPLEKCLLSSFTLSSGHEIRIPSFLVEAYAFISKSITVEGLFRVSGNIKSQSKLLIDIEENGKIAFEGAYVHEVTGLVKKFFRNLPTPILANKEMQETLQQCMKTEIYASRCLRVALLMLPTLHLYTLTSFLQFLKKVSTHESENKMDSLALAICVTPSLMSMNDLENVNIFIQIVKILIDDANKVGIVPQRTLNEYQLRAQEPQKSFLTQIIEWFWSFINEFKQ